MRRMYSEQELTNVIKAVFEQELEDGALDDKVVDAVDDYLTEHPVDPTAITGLDIAPKDVTASGNITAPSIIENMIGYVFIPKESITGYSFSYVYVGVVKNGNKLTFVTSLKITKTDADAGATQSLGTFQVPQEVHDALYPVTIGGSDVLTTQKVQASSSYQNSVDCPAWMTKGVSRTLSIGANLTNLVVNTEYYIRQEVTFLLSSNMISE